MLSVNSKIVGPRTENNCCFGWWWRNHFHTFYYDVIWKWRHYYLKIQFSYHGPTIFGFLDNFYIRIGRKINLYTIHPWDTKNLELTPRWGKSNIKSVNFFVAIKNYIFSGFSVFTFSKDIRPPLSGGFYRMKISYCATKCGLLKVRRRFTYKLSSPHLSFNHISKLYFRWKYCSEMARI